VCTRRLRFAVCTLCSPTVFLGPPPPPPPLSTWPLCRPPTEGGEGGGEEGGEGRGGGGEGGGDRGRGVERGWEEGGGEDTRRKGYFFLPYCRWRCCCRRRRCRGRCCHCPSADTTAKTEVGQECCCFHRRCRRRRRRHHYRGYRYYRLHCTALHWHPLDYTRLVHGTASRCFRTSTRRLPPSAHLSLWGVHL
jgi:hypothetical protein